MAQFNLSLPCDVLITALLVSITLCSVGLVYAAVSTARTLRRSADQLLDFAGELLELLGLEHPPHLVAAPYDPYPAISRDSSAPSSPPVSAREMLQRFLTVGPVPASWYPYTATVTTAPDRAATVSSSSPDHREALRHLLARHPGWNTPRSPAQSPREDGPVSPQDETTYHTPLESPICLDPGYGPHNVWPGLLHPFPRAGLYIQSPWLPSAQSCDCCREPEE